MHSNQLPSCQFDGPLPGNILVIIIRTTGSCLESQYLGPGFSSDANFIVNIIKLLGMRSTGSFAAEFDVQPSLFHEIMHSLSRVPCSVDRILSCYMDNLSWDSGDVTTSCLVTRSFPREE